MVAKMHDPSEIEGFTVCKIILWWLVSKLFNHSTISLVELPRSGGEVADFEC